MLHLSESSFHNVRHVLYSKFLKFVICVEMWICNCSPKMWRPGGGGGYFNYGSIICRIRGKSGPGGICFGRGLTSGGVHVWLHALHAKAWGGHISVGGASFSGRGEGMTVLMGRINNFFKRLLKKIFKKGC